MSNYLLLPIMIVLLYLISYWGEKKKNDFTFYKKNGKGTLNGKIVFSILLILTLIPPYFFFNDKVWLNSVYITFLIFIAFEVILAMKGLKLKHNKDTIGIGIAIIVVALSLPFLKMTPLEAFKVVIFAIFIDLGANLLGKNIFEKLPPKIRLKYPDWISKNKSFSGAMLSIAIVVYFSNFIPNEWSFTSLQVFTIGFSAVIGDAIFSVFKRKTGVDDFYPTLGPIGGVSDRADSWIFALISVSVLLGTQRKGQGNPSAFFTS